MAEKTKDQLIIEAAYEVFSHKGFQKTTMEEIAEQAGVGKGTLYEYFKGKKHLFEEMFQSYFEKYFTGITKGTENQTKAIDKIHIIIDNHINSSVRFRNLFMSLASEPRANTDLSADAKKKIISIFHNNVNEVKKIIEDGIKEGDFREIDAELAAVYFLGSLTGLGHSTVFLTLNFDPARISTKVLDLFINGIKK